MFTANTMSSVIEAMGLSLPHSSTVAAEDNEATENAARSATVLAEAIRKQILPREILTRKGLRTQSVVMAIGGSTNAVLHLLAIAHAAEVRCPSMILKRFAAACRAVRSKTFRSLRRDRPAPRWRHSAGDEAAADS